MALIVSLLSLKTTVVANKESAHTIDSCQTISNHVPRVEKGVISMS